ncbi:hypothetical protein F4778DRAFT_728135 [Xylariomycetidae sp. FL2044]|nr:hypothetical protein F4778DRAFT_728135 [Xylariomycetidae sp. FL2044]
MNSSFVFQKNLIRFVVIVVAAAAAAACSGESVPNPKFIYKFVDMEKPNSHFRSYASKASQPPHRELYLPESKHIKLGRYLVLTPL